MSVFTCHFFFFLIDIFQTLNKHIDDNNDYTESCTTYNSISKLMCRQTTTPPFQCLHIIWINCILIITMIGIQNADIIICVADDRHQSPFHLNYNMKIMSLSNNFNCILLCSPCSPNDRFRLNEFSTEISKLIQTNDSYKMWYFKFMLYSMFLIAWDTTKILIANNCAIVWIGLFMAVNLKQILKRVPNGLWGVCNESVYVNCWIFFNDVKIKMKQTHMTQLYWLPYLECTAHSFSPFSPQITSNK